MKDRLGAAWFGPVRVVLLVLVALAALTDVTTYAALQGGGDRPSDRPGTGTGDEPDDGPAGPDEVALTVVQAVADEDCSDIDTLLDVGYASPSIADCVAGVERTVALTEVEVLGTTTEGGTSVVTFTMDADGEPAEVVVELRRDAERWLVTEMRPGGG